MRNQAQDLESIVIAELSEERVWGHVRHLVEGIPNRISGGGGDFQAAEYFRGELQGCGLDVEWCEMELFNSRPGTADVRVLSPETRVLDADCCLHIASTAPEGISGELVFVGPGGLSDYDRKEVRGRIVLAEVSHAPATPEKARIAATHGAVGIILMNWGTRDMPYVPKRALKSVWGNPTPTTSENIPQVAGVAITRAAGEYLRDLCGRGPVRVRLRAESLREWQSLVQPVGRLRVGAGDGQFIIVSGHFDCWPPGATDNATGNGTMLELARVFGNRADELRRSLVFAFWNGHEVAEAAGSTWYVDHDWDDIQRHAVAYLNIDSQGLMGASRFVANSSFELTVFHQDVEMRVLGEPGTHRPLSRTGDQSFLGIGVPSIAGRFSFTAEQVAAWNGAMLGWWNHTDQDTLDKVDRALVARELSVWAAYLAGLAGAVVLPTRFAPLAQSIMEAIRNLPPGGADQIGLTSLVALASRFVDSARALDAFADAVADRFSRRRGSALEDTANELNQVLMQLSRLLTAPTRSVAGRYGQDSYDLSDLTAPVPSLVPLARLMALPPSSEEARLLRTELRRRRNTIADGLSDATWLIDRTLARLK